METIVVTVSNIWLDQMLWLVGLGIGFTLLARLSAAEPGQKILRDEFVTDLQYWFFMPLIYPPIFFIVITLGFLIVDPDANIVKIVKEGRAIFTDWPIWLQCLAILFISDVVQYWIHRMFHMHRFWRWHAIHHMPTELDWLSSIRFHPVNIFMSTILVGAAFVVAGFSPLAFAYLAIFNRLYSSMVHANLDWHFGPLRYVFASPVFHRWHHTSVELGGNKNFAPTFAFIDVIGGTFYMPMKDRPENHAFGVSDAIPRNRFWAQLIWPFRQ